MVTRVVVVDARVVGGAVVVDVEALVVDVVVELVDVVDARGRVASLDERVEP